MKHADNFNRYIHTYIEPIKNGNFLYRTEARFTTPLHPYFILIVDKLKLFLRELGLQTHL